MPWHRLRKRKVTFPEFVVRVAAGIRERLVVSDFWRKQAEFCSLGHFKKTYQYPAVAGKRFSFFLLDDASDCTFCFDSFLVRNMFS